MIDRCFNGNNWVKSSGKNIFYPLFGANFYQNQPLRVAIFWPYVEIYQVFKQGH